MHKFTPKMPSLTAQTGVGAGGRVKIRERLATLEAALPHLTSGSELPILRITQLGSSARVRVDEVMVW